jgi:hypothetical protein
LQKTRIFFELANTNSEAAPNSFSKQRTIYNSEFYSRFLRQQYNLKEETP